MISQREIERQYSKLMNDIATKDYYKVDLENRVNVYTCLNGHRTKTINKDAGTTPMFMSCPECGVQSKSSWYKDIAPDIEPSIEWYRPSLSECLKMRGKKEPLLDHVLMGGLDTRKIK